MLKKKRHPKVPKHQKHMQGGLESMLYKTDPPKVKWKFSFKNQFQHFTNQKKTCKKLQNNEETFIRTVDPIQEVLKTSKYLLNTYPI